MLELRAREDQAEGVESQGLACEKERAREGHDGQIAVEATIDCGGVAKQEVLSRAPVTRRV